MPNDTDASIGRNVKAEMVRRGVTQMDIADLISVSQTAVSARLAGRTAWKVTELQTIAAAFSVTMETLLGSIPATGVAS